MPKNPSAGANQGKDPGIVSSKNGRLSTTPDPSKTNPKHEKHRRHKRKIGRKGKRNAKRN